MPRDNEAAHMLGRISRRRMLQIGALGGLGLTLPSLLRAEASATAAPQARKPIKSCILMFYYGGPSHIDTFDMKLNAPREVRGEFEPISTSLPGYSVCEHMPLTARIIDRLTVIRSVHHPMRNHNAAAVEALCGRTPLAGDLELLADDASAFPCYGSALNYLMQDQPCELPYVALPHPLRNVVQLPGQTPGFLGSAYTGFQIDSDPSSPNFNVSTLSLPGDMSSDRLLQRESLVDSIDRSRGRLAPVDDLRSMQTFYDKAFSLLRSTSVREAMEISRETPETRDRYGRHTLGQSALLARRLVESGVRFVSVYDKFVNGQDVNWDSHMSVFPRHREHLLPPADQAYSALIEDLERRGLLESTLVISMGEFGRTPRINAGAGRDHWPDCFTVSMAGGGVPGGLIYGTSDAIGAYPETDAVSPGDIAATLFAKFGIDPHTEVHDITGRPWPIAAGKPIEALFV